MQRLAEIQRFGCVPCLDEPASLLGQHQNEEERLSLCPFTPSGAAIDQCRLAKIIPPAAVGSEVNLLSISTIGTSS
jgi:hypothetical protein